MCDHDKSPLLFGSGMMFKGFFLTIYSTFSDSLSLTKKINSFRVILSGEGDEKKKLLDSSPLPGESGKMSRRQQACRAGTRTVPKDRA